MSELLADFHFLRPGWLAALVPLALLVRMLARRAGVNAHWTRICDPALLPHLLVERPRPARRRRLAPFALGGLLGVLAMAGPTVERLPQPVYRGQTAYVLALDLSTAMLATDLSPNRLERAKLKIRDLLAERRDGQVGLIVFAAQAFVVTPLTSDANTLAALFPTLAPDIMPAPGRDLPKAVAKAAALLTQAGAMRGDILLITSDVPPGQRDAAASAAHAGGFRLSILGVGTPEGAPIPQPIGGFREDAAGQVMMARLDEAALADLARRGGGIYSRLQPDGRDVAAFAAFFDRREAPSAAARADAHADRWRDAGPWLLLPLLACAALAFRRGVLAAVALVVALGQVPPAAAGWWSTPDQAGKRAFAAQDYDGAATRFADPAWRAAALYRAGRYDAAAAVLEGHGDAESNYNRGNALAKVGRYREAITAYERALDADPRHEDAKFNKALIEKKLEKPPSDEHQAHARTAEDRTQDQRSPNGDGTDAREQSRHSASERPGKDTAAELTHSAKRAEEQRGEGGIRQRSDSTGAAPPSAGDERQEDENDSQRPAAAGESRRMEENRLATEQWLRQIPDDPGGLLRRKFKYLYNRDTGEDPTSER